MPVSAVIDAVAVVMALAGDSRPLAQLKAVSAAAKIAAQTATDPALPSISWHCWRRATRRPDGQCGFWHCCPHCFQPQAMARLPLLPGLPALPSLVYASHPPPTAARWCAAFRCCHGFRLSWWIVRMDAPADRRRPCHGPDQSARSACTALARGWSEHTERACGQAAPLRAQVAKNAGLKKSPGAEWSPNSRTLRNLGLVHTTAPERREHKKKSKKDTHTHRTHCGS